MVSENQKANRLINETSPYLLQHAQNPVSWWPWCKEAFAAAKENDLPIFLSIGYSTCHWCHVMEQESFEDAQVADFLNKHFISIKVDREERPDIDNIYMAACQAFTGRGGWPLSVFITPEKQPFFAGSYFPKNSSQGMIGFLDLLSRIAELWQKDRASLVETGQKAIAVLQKEATAQKKEPDFQVLKVAFDQFVGTFDDYFGGFGQAPKFPSPHNLLFLLRYHHATGDAKALQMVQKTLVCMARGGIFDQVGFGFARYSTDPMWFAPHFEKMLYDNALLAIVYAEAWQITKEPFFKQIADETLLFVEREMTGPEGCFFSAQDADSEGEEGKFYLWSTSEVAGVLDKEEASFFAKNFDITPEGNFNGSCIPNLVGNPDFKKDEKTLAILNKLYLYRQKRPRPFLDDKILLGWSSLMITAFSVCGRIFKNELYVKQAQMAADFIFTKMQVQNGRFFATYRASQAKLLAYAQDYVFLMWGFLELYAATFEADYLKKALAIEQILQEDFWDEENGGLFISDKNKSDLPLLTKEIYDGALPSANAVYMTCLIRLSHLVADVKLEARAKSILACFAAEIEAMPAAHAMSLVALLYLQNSGQDIVITSQKKASAQPMIDIINSRFAPFSTLLLKTEENDLTGFVPHANNMKLEAGKTAAYICQGQLCQQPIFSLEDLQNAL